MVREPEGIETLIEGVRRSRKYRSIAPDLIRAVGEKELARPLSLHAAVKTTKRKLHQVAGAFLPSGMLTENWLREIGMARGDGLASACTRIMACHLSTRERLPFLDDYYLRLLGGIGPIRSVMDLGCGLNPLAIPWMRLPDDCVYWAYDIFEDMALMLESFFAVIGFRGHAEARDVIHRIPTHEVDLALLLKLLPCVEQISVGAGKRLLNVLNTKWLIASFPVHSLCGQRGKGMLTHYQDGFLRLADDQGWSVDRRFIFPNELVFRCVRVERADP